MGITQGERLAALETKIPELEKRIDKQDELMQELHIQGEALAVVAEQIKQITKCTEQQSLRLDEIEQKPSKRWDTVIAAMIAAAVSLVITQLT